MRVVPTELSGVLVLEPRVHSDHRGCFYESWNARVFAEATGISAEFVQDNHACSIRNVLRGIHYQVVRPQGKAIRVTAGSVLDVAVDLRRSSLTFRRWVAVELSADNKRQLWIPPGFGHGYAVRGESATVIYKTTEYWTPEHDRSVRWNDPELGIEWGIEGSPVLSAKDAEAPLLADAELFP
jgi:dTDP-4-dehydrorhamnose 3,5-epimerase